MTTAVKDYYEVLGIPRTAGLDEIKKAYRVRALQWHPDRHQGDKSAEERFKEVNEAYGVLSDPAKRARYDQGETPEFRGAGPGFGGTGEHQGFEDVSGLGDIFSRFFGGLGGRQGATRARDFEFEAARYQLDVTLAQAFHGAVTDLKLARPAPCGACDGRGTAAGRRGAPCAACGGLGTVQREETVRVRIPAGVSEGTELRVPGRGGAGDVILSVHVAADPRFTREGDDLIVRQAVSVPTAVLGGEARVSALDRSWRIRVPAGSRPGVTLRVKGAGMPRLNTRGRGDLLVKLEVDVPGRLTPAQRKLYEDLAGLERAGFQGG